MKDSTLGHSRVSDSSRLAHKNVLPSNPDYKSRMQREGVFLLPLPCHDISVLSSHSSPHYRQRPEDDPKVKVPDKSVVLKAYVLKEIQSLSCISSFHEVSQHTKLRLISWSKPTSHLFRFLSPTLAHGVQL